MGTCDSLCSRSGTINQTIPTTESMKLRSPISPEGDAGTISKHIDKHYKNGNTLLHIAVQQGDHTLIENILKNGASVNAQNADGDTSLLMAARLDDRDAIKLLLDYSADPHISNNDKETMLTINGFHDNSYDELKYDESEYSLTSSSASPEPASMNGMNNTSNDQEFKPGVDTLKLHGNVDDILSDSPNMNAAPSLNQMKDANTMKLRHIASSIFHDMKDSVTKNKEKLVPIKGWIFHKQSKPPYKWLKRWVVIQNGYMLWSDRQMDIENDIDTKEMKRWNKSIALRMVKNVSPINAKQERRFCVSVKGQKREYIWRCGTKFARDTWVEILHQHMEYSKQENMYSVEF